MKRVLLIAVTAVATAALVAVGAATADTTFTDPSGDSATAPDVTNVAVSNDAGGKITFKVTVANQAALAPDAEFQIIVDSDHNGATGDEGWEYLFVLNGKEQKWGLGHWNGTDYDFDAPTTTADVTYDAGVLTFSINKSELGNTGVFAFYVWAGQIGPDDKTIASDDAPDGSGVWEYTLTAAPKPLVLTAGKPVGKPARPQSGKAFVVTVPVRRSDTGRPATSGGTIACKATVGAKAVKAAGRFSAAGPQCVVRVPAKSSGKTLRGTITVTIKGAKVTKAFAFRVA